MKILLTGGTGAIGIKLTNILQKNNDYQITLLTKEDIKPNNDQIEYVRGDIQDQTILNNACTDIDLAIHMAAITHTHNENDYFAINTDGTKKLLEACSLNHVPKFIFISSTTSSREGGAYAYSKLLAEEEVKKYKYDWIILRLSEVYGINKNEAISKIINTVKTNFFVPIVGDGGYKLCPVHIDDVLSAIMSAINKTSLSKSIYNIAGPFELTYNEIIEIIEKNLNQNRLKLNIPIIIIKHLAWLCRLFDLKIIVKDQIPRLICKKNYDIENAKKELSFYPDNFESGIKKL